MRFKLLICSLVLFTASYSFSQNPMGEDGFQFSLAGGYSTKGIPVVISYEMGINENMTFGIQALFRTYSEKTDTNQFDHTIMGLSFFGNYYFNELLKIDEDKWGLYGGVNFGYYKWFSPEASVDVQKGTSTLGAGVQIGGRYYIKDFGIFLEAQAGTENVSGLLGVTYRFPY